MRSVRTVRSITEIPRQAWDELAGDNVMAGHGWLKTVEETSSVCLAPKYYLLEENGRIIAGCVGYRMERQNGPAGLDVVLFGRLERFLTRLGISFLPHAMCRPYRSNGAHILVRKELDSPSVKAAIRDILPVLETEAFHQRLPVVFSGVLEMEADLMEVLSRSGYHQTYSSPVSIVDLNFNSFDEYMKSLDSASPNTRKVIRREMNKIRKEGVVIEEVKDPGEDNGRLYELISGNYRKYNTVSFPFNENFLEALKANLGDEVAIYKAVKNGRVTGGSVDLRRNGYQFTPYVGVDHEAAGNDFTYFNMAYYRPIMRAIESGIPRLNWGTAFYDIKTRRGAKVYNSYIFHKSPDGIHHFLARLWFKLHAALWKKKLARLNNGRPPRLMKAVQGDAADEGKD
jgi:predicted N-acyltransferase